LRHEDINTNSSVLKAH